MTITLTAIAIVTARMDRLWAAHVEATRTGHRDDARELLGFYNEAGFVLAKLRMRVRYYTEGV